MPLVTFHLQAFDRVRSCRNSLAFQLLHIELGTEMLPLLRHKFRMHAHACKQYTHACKQYTHAHACKQYTHAHACKQYTHACKQYTHACKQYTHAQACKHYTHALRHLTYAFPKWKLLHANKVQTYMQARAPSEQFQSANFHTQKHTLWCSPKVQTNTCKFTRFHSHTHAHTLHAHLCCAVSSCSWPLFPEGALEPSQSSTNARLKSATRCAGSF